MAMGQGRNGALSTATCVPGSPMRKSCPPAGFTLSFALSAGGVGFEVGVAVEFAVGVGFEVGVGVEVAVAVVVVAGFAVAVGLPGASATFISPDPSRSLFPRVPVAFTAPHTTSGTSTSVANATLTPALLRAKPAGGGT